MAGRMFEMTLEGIREMTPGARAMTHGDAIVPGGKALEALQAAAASPAGQAPASNRVRSGDALAALDGPVSTKPADVKRWLRARIKEVKLVLKDHAKLKAELAELERWLKAAQERPAKVVRQLRSAG